MEKGHPKLETYPKVYTLKNPQNSVISNNNLSDIICTESDDAIFKRSIEAMQNTSKPD